MTDYEFYGRYTPHVWDEETDEFKQSAMCRALMLDRQITAVSCPDSSGSYYKPADVEQMVILFCSILGQNFFCSRHELHTKSDVSIPYGINGADNLVGILGKISKYLKAKKMITKMDISETKEFRVFGTVSLYKKDALLLRVAIGWVFGESGAYIRRMEASNGIPINIEEYVANRLLPLFYQVQPLSASTLFELFAISENMSFDIREASKKLDVRDEGDCFELNKFPFTEEMIIALLNAYKRLELPSVVAECGVLKPEFKDVFNRFAVLTHGCLNATSIMRWDASDGRLVKGISMYQKVSALAGNNYDNLTNAYTSVDSDCVIAYGDNSHGLQFEPFAGHPSILTEYAQLDGINVGGFTYRFSPFAKDTYETVRYKGSSSFRLPTLERMFAECVLLESINHLKLPYSAFVEYRNVHDNLEHLEEVFNYFHVPFNIFIESCKGVPS